MKSKFAIGIAITALGLASVAYLMSDKPGAEHQGEMASAPRPTPASPQSSTQPPTLQEPVKQPSAHVDYAKLSSQMTPKEAHVIANAILNCNVVQFSGQAIEGRSVTTEQKELEKNCDQMKSEFSVYDLAKFAAQSGDPQAQLDFPALAAGAFDDEQAALNPALIDDYKKSSLSYLEQASKSGKIEALSRLSESYSSGRFSEANPVLAYAYAYAYARHSGSNIAQRLAQQLSAPLKADEVTQAHRLARDM
ncbi:hypothetical protein [Stenotrophomonas sp. Iso1]|uniref:hypothetical protein n=1 Tax=Stenotrophomonas sp. Iso1 TaxID=2977283 RepID=UPI0022B7B700|nr:hypothetical protein [Stenotrophomonas sp. Iso1]